MKNFKLKEVGERERNKYCISLHTQQSSEKGKEKIPSVS